MKCHGVEEFNLKGLKWKEYKDTCFHDGDCVLVVELWLHRVDEDDSGITFGTGHDVSEYQLVTLGLQPMFCTC